jgi:hypothetical protein
VAISRTAALLLGLLLLGLLLAACSGGAASPAPPATAYSARGVSVELPGGWQHAATSLTPQLLDPREVMSLATYRMVYRSIGCAQVPTSALAAIGQTGVLISLQERGRGTGPSGFPGRPRSFGPHPGDGSEAPACVPAVRFESHWLPFSVAGRRFYALVAFGLRAPAATRAQAWRILDGLRVDPSIRPDWRASG